MAPTKARGSGLLAPLPHKRKSLAEDLRRLARTLEPGSRLPSVPVLMREFGLSSATVQAALEELRRDGIVVSRRGSGTFVAEPRRASARTRTLAVAVAHRNPFYLHVIDRMSADARERGLTVVCRFDHDETALQDALSLLAVEPAALVLMGERERDVDVEAELWSRGHRVIRFGERTLFTSAPVPVVCSDGEEGGYRATRHLLDLGHRPERILYAHWLQSPDALTRKPRWAGHVRALQEAGDAPGAAVNRVAWLGGSGGGEWLRRPELVRARFTSPGAPTGVVAWSDHVAVAAVEALRAAGLSVPGDVSVIGYDDLPVAASCDPPLTSVDQQLGAQIHHLFDLVDAGATPNAASDAAAHSGESSPLFVPVVVRRASCGAPAARP